jgi:hypothetical protein
MWARARQVYRSGCSPRPTKIPSSRHEGLGAISTFLDAERATKAAGSASRPVTCYVARMRISLAILPSLVLLSLAACGSAPGGVQGRALIEGGPAPGNPRPEPGVTVAVHKGGLHGTIVARTKASPSGAFKISLSPGNYTLVEISDAAVPRTVTVKPGKYVTVVLMIEAM